MLKKILMKVPNSTLFFKTPGKTYYEIDTEELDNFNVPIFQIMQLKNIYA